jgi:hypothetical protein
MKTKRFKEIITGVNQLPLSKQKTELESKYYNWKGNEFQIDDILVIGVQYPC